MGDIRSVPLENVQDCLEDMGLDFSKYKKLNAEQERHWQINTLDIIEEN